MVQFRTRRNGTSCGEDWKFFFFILKLALKNRPKSNKQLIEMKFVFRGIFSASLLIFTIESFGYTKDAEVISRKSANEPLNRTI